MTLCQTSPHHCAGAGRNLLVHPCEGKGKVIFQGLFFGLFQVFSPLNNGIMRILSVYFAISIQLNDFRQVFVFQIGCVLDQTVVIFIIVGDFNVLQIIPSLFVGFYR